MVEHHSINAQSPVAGHRGWRVSLYCYLTLTVWVAWVVPVPLTMVVL